MTNEWMSSLLSFVESPYSRSTVWNWPLTSGNACLTIILLYVMGTVVLRYVMNFLPSLEKYTCYLRFIYNPAQVFISSYMFLGAIELAWGNGYSCWPCQAYNSTKPTMLRITYLFYISKIFDLFDTVFIILGKKWKQLSFLHVYHHATVIAMFWVNVHVCFDGDVVFPIAANGFIHSIMYMYYFVTLHVQNIWWKKFVTYCQMTQFVGMILQSIILEYSCKDYPVHVNRLYGMYTFSMLVLFLIYFKKEYKIKVK